MTMTSTMTSTMLQALDVLHGSWKLVYTSNPQALAVLEAVSLLPVISIGDVFQNIDGRQLTAENSIQLAAPFRMDMTASTGFEVRTPRQYKVKFVTVGLNTHLRTPEIFTTIEVPNSVRIGTVDLDLTPLQRLLQPIEAGMQSVQELFRYGSKPWVPAGSVPTSFLLTTYVDQDMRIARGSDNSIWAFVKDIGMREDTEGKK